MQKPTKRKACSQAQAGGSVQRGKIFVVRRRNRVPDPGPQEEEAVVILMPMRTKDV
jgi:hypothetical protein